ncbi:protein Shroom isoform X2 [Diachasmimorpha longicaudata]|uniref:protein Shroom isoform X2 n=1 Tax=Diachasmimorpha longicaudata TaxID=58733 RepID=UPI0030B8B507
MTDLQPSLSGYRGQDEASIPSNSDENIYRYNESVGFDSFTLLHDGRENESPPPTPPVRDASSLKSVCYGPGHEKYPSWPSTRESEEKNASCNVTLGSHRSKSWTDHTNYPKEKLIQYTRPMTKRSTPTFTHQLKTVMEKCEKIPAESFESRKSCANNQQRDLRLWPRVDREGKSYGDSEYVVPSPPEREQHQPLQTLNHADFEAYIRNYPDSQVDCYSGPTLTQEGLEDYTRVEHGQQASYAQSEGYHSYVSSLDSTTNTPFLDRLRRDSEAVAHRSTLSTWEDISHEGRDSVVTTSSGGSASSSETLKWHGSLSDVSISSGLQARRLTSEKWKHASISDVSSVEESIQKLTLSNDCKCQSTKTNSNVKIPKVIENPECLSGIINQCTFVNTGICQMTLASKDDYIGDRYFPKTDANSLHSCASKSINEPKEEWDLNDDGVPDVDPPNITVNGTSKQLIAHSSRVQTPQRHHSESILYLDKKRNQRKFHPASSPLAVHNNQSLRLSPSSQQPHLSVSDRVDELEKQQQIRYTYLDPDKRHRVSDPTLKAIQKKALLSFYERHHQSSWRSEPQLIPGGHVPHNSSLQPSLRSKMNSPRRASSASDYANSNWRNNNNNNNQQHQHQTNKKPNSSDSLDPKHKHSNSCGSLSSALMGPMIIGTAISIDDWVPERPPKKPHLRSLYTDRIPSPDLPPPSPPPVTENEVYNCDDPLPPPPAELHNGIGELCKTNVYCSDNFHVNGNNNSIRRLKHEKKLTINSSNDEFSQLSMRQTEKGCFTSNHSTGGRSSFRYPSSKYLGEINNGKLPKISGVSQDYGTPGRNYELGSEESIKSWGAMQVSTGRLHRDTGSLTFGQKPQPQVSRNHSISSKQAPKVNHSVLSDSGKSYQYSDSNSTHKFIESNSKSLEEKSSKKYDELSQYFPYYQQPPNYPSLDSTDAQRNPQVSHAHLSSLSPPPLAPRQNMPGVKSLPPPPRPAPPVQMFHRKPSKTSYAVHKHERDSADNKNYKSPMAPAAHVQKWPAYQKRDTAYPRQISSSHHNSEKYNSPSSYHSQTLDRRINENQNINHSGMVTGKLLNGSCGLFPKHSNAIVDNNNINMIVTNDCPGYSEHPLDDQTATLHNYKTDRLILNDAEPFNDGNSQQGEGGTHSVVTTIEITGDNHRSQKHSAAGSADEIHVENVENISDEIINTVQSSSLSHSNEYEKSHSKNNEDRSTTSTSFSCHSPGEIIDYDNQCDSSLKNSPPVNDDVIENIQHENSLSDGSSQKENLWTKSDACQAESLSTNSLRKNPPSECRSPLLSTKLKMSERSYSPVSSSCSPIDSRLSPCVSPQPGIEELRLLQRTEVVLRINATLDAASQTEVINVHRVEPVDVISERIIPETRKKLPEEIECEELSKNLADQLGPHDKLVPILVPIPDHKKSSDYVSDIFRIQTIPPPRFKSSESHLLENDGGVGEEHLNSRGSINKTTTPLSPTSEYFTISECKARFLARYSHQIMDEETARIDELSSSSSAINSFDLRQKKEELVLRLDRKVVVLRAEQEALREEDETNEALGAKVATRVSALARPAEVSKFRLHIEEIGKITSLLLGLSGRLARVENALHGMAIEHPEKKILESKRDKLLEQLEEAKTLKVNIDKRSSNVSAILSKYLNDEEFADYQHFINMKTKLIVDSRELQDKVKLGEEQLSALKDAI